MKNGARAFDFAKYGVRSAFNRLHLRSSSGIGLSTDDRRPSRVHVQPPQSPEIAPGQLLISIRKAPFLASTRRSTSLMLPSAARNSKFAQARYGS